jgi:F420-non-reducing hydrogenase iron-sulfur subunit
MKVIALCCSFCGYSSADLAGTTGSSYTADVTVIRIPCTGRVDVKHILQSFRLGADAVLVVGCLEGNCNYQYGNIEARKRVAQAKAILQQIGIEPERLRMCNVASNQAWRFVEFVNEMERLVEKIGPSPIDQVRK